MALRLGPHLISLTDQLRFQPVTKRVRATLEAQPVLDTTDAALVWEPGRVVPMYAVPAASLAARLSPCPTPVRPDDPPAVLGPEDFGRHRLPGTSFTVEVAGRSFEAAAFRPEDPDLGGRIIVEWAPFEWTEEAQPVVGHPHDPFKRLDFLVADRHVVVRLGTRVLADTRRAVAVYETHLPTRWYLPADDVVTGLLTPSATTTTCAYKGVASYFSVARARVADAQDDENVAGLDSGPAVDGADVAWTYRDPLPEAAAIKDHVCFYAERTDLCVDGVDQLRPTTLWSRPAPPTS